jgi:hypothetical protein
MKAGSLGAAANMQATACYGLSRTGPTIVLPVFAFAIFIVIETNQCSNVLKTSFPIVQFV